MAATYIVHVAKDREFLSVEHSTHVAESVDDETRALDEAKGEALSIWITGEFGRVSIWRRDERGEIWLRSWVETTNASEREKGVI